MSIISKPAKCGCEGCCFENSNDCPVEKLIEGLPYAAWPPKEEWECNKDGSIIYIEEE